MKATAKITVNANLYLVLYGPTVAKNRCEQLEQGVVAVYNNHCTDRRALSPALETMALDCLKAYPEHTKRWGSPMPKLWEV